MQYNVLHYIFFLVFPHLNPKNETNPILRSIFFRPTTVLLWGFYSNVKNHEIHYNVYTVNFKLEIPHPCPPSFATPTPATANFIFISQT